MTGTGAKSEGALWTIGEVSDRFDIPQHILRYWETRFAQLRPLQRAGNRRYYRPDDVALVERINRLLNQEGYTVKGVQKLLSGKPRRDDPDPASAVGAQVAASAVASDRSRDQLLSELRAIRERLVRVLDDEPSREPAGR